MTVPAFAEGRLAGSALALHRFSAEAGAEEVHLRLMGTTDVHVHLHPYDYYSDRPSDSVGLARTASHVVDARAEATNALLLDNGDFLQGNPMGDFVAQERGLGDGAVHPVVAAMNAMGVDAATLGNHEFDYGLDYLAAALADAAFPIVSANFQRTEAAACPIARPWVILERAVTDGAGQIHRLRIGVTGFAPPQTATWDRMHLHDRATIGDIVAAARVCVPQMRAAGADLVIALVHSGIGPVDQSDGIENAATALAGVPGIDAIFAGHAHQVFPSDAFAGMSGVDAVRGTLQGVPAAMAGFWGSHLGIIDLRLRREADRWRVAAHEVVTRPIASRMDDQSVAACVGSLPHVLAATQAAHEATLHYVRRPLGRTATPIDSYFALVSDDVSVRIVAQAQLWYMNGRLAGTPWDGLPVLSAAAPFKAGGRGGPEHYVNVPAGPLTLRDAASLYIYPNTLRAICIGGGDVACWLERSAGLFRQIRPGAVDAPLIDPDFPSYNFSGLHGLTWKIDLSQPARYDRRGTLADPDARRVVDLRCNGTPVDPAARFVVVTNSYRAGGGGAFFRVDDVDIIHTATETNRDVVVRYIASHETVDAGGGSCWSFVPMPGTTVTFDSAPAGADRAHLVPGLDIAPAGPAPGGFMRYRIRL